MVGWRASVALGLTALVGCGGDDAGGQADPGSVPRTDPATTTKRAPQVELSPVPQAAVDRCSDLAARRDIPVLCPTRLPDARWFVRYQTLATGRDEYLTNLETRPHGSGDPFHVLAGGRRGRFSLEVQAGKWPAERDTPRGLRLVGARALKPGQAWEDQQDVPLTLLRRATVREHPALLLRASQYPTGGVHGGHLAVVWNQGGNGYALSMHFQDDSPRSEAERQTVLLEAATAMSGFDAEHKAR